MFYIRVSLGCKFLRWALFILPNCPLKEKLGSFIDGLGEFENEIEGNQQK